MNEIKNKIDNNNDLITNINELINQIKGPISQEVAFLLSTLTHNIEDKFLGVRLNIIGLPLHPLESELLDIIDGKTNLMTLNGAKVPIEYYKQRKTVNQKKENAVEFFNRVYGNYIKEGVIYADYLRKIDENLIRAFEGCGNFKIEGVTERNKKLVTDNKRLDKINITSLQTIISKVKIK